MKKIKITCKGQKYLAVEELQGFQGNLKNLNANELEKLKRSILKYGFSFPVFVWGQQMLDGHQRIFAVKNLLKNGYSIDKIPVVEIDAENETEAAEKLLLLNSRYAKMTDEGLYEFLAEHSVDLFGIKDDLSLPEIDIDKFIAGLGDKDSVDMDDIGFKDPAVEKQTISITFLKVDEQKIINELNRMSGDYDGFNFYL